jgi:hypothetical protein
MCANEDTPDVVDASLAWWAKQRNVEVLSGDPEVRRYADKIGARFRSLDVVN